MRLASLLLAAAGLAALAGCDSGPPTGDVSGTASFENVPIADGTITFFPADGKGGTAGGFIKDGKYSVQKVPVGVMRVQITSKKEAGKKRMYGPGSEEIQMYSDPLPPKYGDPLKSELRFEVKPGANEKNWDLK